jgi:hypothetical protein
VDKREKKVLLDFFSRDIRLARVVQLYIEQFGVYMYIQKSNTKILKKEKPIP